MKEKERAERRKKTVNAAALYINLKKIHFNLKMFKIYMHVFTQVF
jgi:hypothetical protein